MDLEDGIMMARGCGNGLGKWVVELRGVRKGRRWVDASDMVGMRVCCI